MTLVGPAPTPGMIATVRAMGVFEPIIVFKPTEGRLKIGDGIRRIKAAQEAERKDIPAMVYEDEENFRHALTLAANNQRSSNPLAEVRAIMRLQKKRFSQRQIAEATGLTMVRIEERLRLNNVIKPLYDAMFKGQIAVSIGASASRMPKGMQMQLAAKLKKEGKLTQKDVVEAKTVRRAAAMAALPAAIFADEKKEVPELARLGWQLSTFAASVNWSKKPNTEEWLVGLKLRIESFQDAYKKLHGEGEGMKSLAAEKVAVAE
jgi:ParB/RepB/Spo0J family partition protein